MMWNASDIPICERAKNRSFKIPPFCAYPSALNLTRNPRPSEFFESTPPSIHTVDSHRHCPKAVLYWIRYEVRIRACFEDHVSPLPRLIINQTPLMAGTGMIHRQQNISRMNCKGLAADGGKFQYACQRNDILRGRIVVPVIRRMWRCFLEMNGLRSDQCTF